MAGRSFPTRHRERSANHHLLRQLGVGGALAVIVLYVVFEFLIKSGVVTPSPTPTNPQAMDERSRAEFHLMAEQTRDLHMWHNQKDADGRFLWMVPRSMTKAIDEQTDVLRDLSTAIAIQTKVLERMDHGRNSRHSLKK